MSIYTEQMTEALNSWQGIQSAPTPAAMKNPRGIRVCKSDILEYGFARAHPVLPGVWVFPTVAYLLWKSMGYQSLQGTFALFLLGVLVWTIAEYAIHKFVFHIPVTPTTHPALKRVLFMLHGYHHEYPNDPTRLVMPLALAWPLATILGFGFWSLMGSSLFFGFFGGFLIGYLAYDWTHYFEHHIRTKNKFGKYLQEFHAIHHFVNENKNFGISGPIWDWAFGNAQEPRKRG